MTSCARELAKGTEGREGVKSAKNERRPLFSADGSRALRGTPEGKARGPS